MTSVLYCNVNSITHEQVDTYLQLLPGFMQEDVMRYHDITDQKARLLARLMLYQSLDKDGMLPLLQKWRINTNKKPCIDGWSPFNISHSGKMVLFCYSHKACGIDIEKITTNYCDDIKEYFHPEEQRLIAGSNDKQETFYEIWVRKESFLKAIGIGIVNGLDEFSCVDDTIACYGEDWYLYKLSIEPGYTGYLCIPEKDEKIAVTRFCPENIFISHASDKSIH